MTTTLPGVWVWHSTRCSNTALRVSSVVLSTEKQPRRHEPLIVERSVAWPSLGPMQQTSDRARLVWMMRMSVSTVMMASGMERNTASSPARRRSFSMWMSCMACMVSMRWLMSCTMGSRYRGLPAESRTSPAERCTQTSRPSLVR